MKARARKARGFTLVEALTATAIIGLILVLIGYEFDHSLEDLLHTRSNRDLESGARLTMSEVTNRLRSASPYFYINTTGPAPTPDANQVIINPVPVPTPGATATALTFYRVRPGQLADPAAIPSPGQVPNPPFDIVTIERGTNPCNPGCGDPSPNYLIETSVDAVTKAPVRTVVLGKDVTGFEVTTTGTQDAAQVDISLTMTSTNSRCEPAATCSYTTSSSVYIGGEGSQ